MAPHRLASVRQRVCFDFSPPIIVGFKSQLHRLIPRDKIVRKITLLYCPSPQTSQFSVPLLLKGLLQVAAFLQQLEGTVSPFAGDDRVALFPAFWFGDNQIVQQAVRQDALRQFFKAGRVEGFSDIAGVGLQGREGDVLYSHGRFSYFRVALIGFQGRGI